MAAIDEIYDAVCDEAAYARVPGVLARVVKARSAIALELDENMQPLDSVRHAVSDDVMDRYASLDLWRHDLWSHLMARPSHRNRAVRSDEVLDAQTFRDGVFYNELYRPLGDDTARCLGVVLDRMGGRLAIGLHRAYGQPTYDAADAAELQTLVPHLRRMVAARGRLRESEDRLALLTGAFDGLSCGLMILDAGGRLRHANWAAEALMQGRDGLVLRGGRAAPADHLMVARFAEAVRSAATSTGARGDAMRLRRAAGPALRVLVTALTGPTPGALVLLDAENAAPSMRDILVRLYGLTPGEAELAGLLGDGLSPIEAAETRGVRLSTVRSQIQALLQKTDTRGLGDLLRTLGRVSHLSRGG